MFNFERFDFPFTHWVDRCFVSPEQLREINTTWPKDDPNWIHENGKYSKKSALMFPHRLHHAAQNLASDLYSPATVAELSVLTGLALQPDPWFHDGPLSPKVGGGLHEIHPGGALKMHVDFSRHPTGLNRALNLLLYLNEDWRDEWGGALELGDGSVKILPRGGTAVVFATTGTSWHGHPKPLACPADRTRRSLALYYYTDDKPDDRPTTVYRK